MRRIIAILVLSVQLSLWGQPATEDKQGVALLIQTNTQQLLPGEYLYYSIQFKGPSIENPLERQAQLAYIALADSQGKTHAVQQILLEQIGQNYEGQGELFIPTSLATGGYNLVGYTPQMLDRPSQELHQTPIAILNPYSTSRSGEIIEIHPPTEIKATPFIQTPIQGSPNQWIPFELPPNFPQQGRYKLSVKKISTLQTEAFFKENKEVETPEIKPQNNTRTKTQGGISGRLISNRKPIDGVSVALSFVGPNMPFKLTTTNTEGRFNFPLLATVNSPQAVLQVWNDHPADFQMVLDSFPRPTKERLKKVALRLYSSDLESLKNRSIHNQIENAFNPYKQDSIPLENRPMSRLDAFEMNTYTLEEYSRFSSFEETIFEIVREGSYKKTKADRAVLFVKNVVRNVAVAAPVLLLIDGIPVPDHNAFRRYPASEIEKISVSRQQLVMGNQIWNGLVYVQTKEGIPKTYLNQKNIEIRNLELPRLKKKYYQQPKNAPNYIPNYAHTLVWLPNQSTADLRAFKGFKAPDMEGRFELSIEGEDQAGRTYSFRNIYKITN